MPTLKLTQTAAKNLNPASKGYIAFDTELKGFGLRVMPSGKKTWIIEYRPHGGGRSVSKRRYTIAPFDSATNAQAARQMAMDVLARVRQGEDPAGDLSRGRKAETVAEMFAAFMTEHVEQYRKPKTIYEYRLLQRNYIDPSLSHIKANALSRTDIERFIRNSTKAGKKTTANRVLAVLSAAYSWGGKNGIVPPDHNPCKGIEKFKEQGRERFLSIEEINRLWRTLDEAVTMGLPYTVDETKAHGKHAPKPENRYVVYGREPIAAIKLLILTGCRLHEILDLEWSFIDFGRQLIFLPDSKTGKKAVLLSDQAIDILKDLPRDCRFVFPGKDGTKPRSDLKKPWAAVTRHAELNGLRIHDLRHSFASFAAASGVSLQAIGKLLGHKSIKSTERYAHLAEDPLRKAASEVGATIHRYANNA